MKENALRVLRRRTHCPIEKACRTTNKRSKARKSQKDAQINEYENEMQLAADLDGLEHVAIALKKLA
jgi:hypothetical protein